MTCNVLMGTLNPTHSLSQWRCWAQVRAELSVQEMLQLNCQCILLTAAVVAGCHGNVSVFILALASCGFLLISSKRFQSIDDLPVHSRQGSLLPCPSEWSSLLRTRLVVAVSFRAEQFAQDEARCCRVLQSGAVRSGRGSLLPCPSEWSSSLRTRLVVAVSFRAEQFAQDKARPSERSSKPVQVLPCLKTVSSWCSSVTWSSLKWCSPFFAHSILKMLTTICVHNIPPHLRYVATLPRNTLASD